MKRFIIGLLAAASIAAVTVSGAFASTSAQKVRVPNLAGKSLPLAEYLLRNSGLRAGQEDCDCTFGVVIKSSWYVCYQTPRAGSLVRRGTAVGTYSARSPQEC
jgi:beta-lactam-binding protein with PASTA domain